MIKDYYQQSMRALQLAGMSDRTQQSYTRSVRIPVDFYKKTKDKRVLKLICLYLSRDADQRCRHLC
jgi:hypothetical protein